MTRPSFVWRTAIAAVLTIVCAKPASALLIKEFRKHPPKEQSAFVAGAVSMVAYTYASNGDTARARCIQNWFFDPGPDNPGPRKLALEIAVAEERGADKYHVEGVILGKLDRVCGASPPPVSRNGQSPPMK